jgi:hypothetical protein
VVPLIRDVLTTGAQAFERIDEHYQPRVAAGPLLSLQEVTDLSFMARMEVLNQRERLDDVLTQGDINRLLAECGSGRHAVLRSGRAVDEALSHVEGLSVETPPPPVDLDGARQLRAVYAKVRREVHRWGEPASAEVRIRLPKVSAPLEAFIHSPLFQEARPSDRLTLTQLQARIHRWLGGEGGQQPTEGVRLWQDLNASVSLLSQINQRSELLEHDRDLVKELAPRIARVTMVPPEALSRLEQLYGRDDQVDGLIDSGAGMLAVEWHEPMERLSALLGLHRHD